MTEDDYDTNIIKETLCEYSDKTLNHAGILCSHADENCTYHKKGDGKRIICDHYAENKDDDDEWTLALAGD